MKKIAIIAIMATLCVGTANAQSFLSNLFSKFTGSSNTTESTTTNTVTNVLGSLLGNSVTLSKSLIKCTWTYEGASCVLESNDALSKIGGSVATAKIEEKMNTYLAKVGVKNGTCSFTFAENDSCTFKIGTREIKVHTHSTARRRQYSSVSYTENSHLQHMFHTMSHQWTSYSMPTNFWD